MSLSPEMVGRRFGRLVVLEARHVDVGRNRHYLVRCDCGSERVTQGARLRNGMTKSCGCLRDANIALALTVHGDTRGRKAAPEWTAWRNMLTRCDNPNHNRFQHYGGRGIDVCKRWRKSYRNFLKDMGRKPSPTHSLDRKNVNGNYTPSNCRWATIEQQALNKQNSTMRISA